MSSLKHPPQHTQVLVIGGGPAGSYAASALAREGLDVTLCEAATFPRYHVGESLIPSARQYLRFIGAESALVDHGFVFKPGSAIKFNQFKREGYTDFLALGCENNAWNVVRSEFDQLLMNHARASGAAVYERTKVTDVSFSSTDPTKPVSVTWSHTPTPSVSPSTAPWAPLTSFLGKIMSPLTVLKSPVITGTTTFNYLIDATGRAGLLSTKYLKNRHYNASLKNLAVWGYWKGTTLYGAGTARQGSPWFEALTDESGWAWFIPLHDGTISIGIVVNHKIFDRALKQPLPPSPFSHPSTFNPTNSKIIAYYLSALALAPGVVELITSGGSMVEGSVKSASDFSYSAASYAGSNYRIVGDAGAFIDPFFSSGIHLAFTSALSASATICASIRGHCPELSAAEWHSRRVSTSYTRFQIVVLSAYKQIRAQKMDILCDIDEDNYDRAFAFLRPVIQGASDMGVRLSETELQKSLDFCVSLFNPTSPEQHERLSRSSGLCNEVFDINAPLVDPAIFRDALQIGFQSLDSCSEIDSDSDTDGDQSFSESDRVLETKLILEKINARRVIHSEYHLNNMEVESIGGYVMRLEKGTLGLARTTHKAR
ncbi:hypothetical protein E4T56_gene7323 [Termitomyces sp. T112]|nr:hypothetical protein E4T56_gene7323 [Termitomyces sp. T112]KAH0589128.1 hypothetical protein H2248_004896 [Termitomyces sp. 'cryptogamus']